MERQLIESTRRNQKHASARAGAKPPETARCTQCGGIQVKGKWMAAGSAAACCGISPRCGWLLSTGCCISFLVWRPSVSAKSCCRSPRRAQPAVELSDAIAEGGVQIPSPNPPRSKHVSGCRRFLRRPVDTAGNQEDACRAVSRQVRYARPDARSVTLGSNTRPPSTARSRKAAVTSAPSRMISQVI